MKKLISARLICATMLAVASIANAAPYSVTYTDTISAASIAGINVGEQTTATLVFDNGNTSVANQTWSAADVQCVIFRFNNANDKFAAVNYAGAPFTSETLGTFTTNGTGQLQAGIIDYEDFSDSITNPFVSNIVGVTSFDDWYLNARNSVVYLNVGPIAYTNVANDTQVTNWTNPVPASGLCASFFQPASQTLQPVPALGQWGVIILAVLIGMAALPWRRRQKRG
jgi:hypothetical protein